MTFIEAIKTGRPMRRKSSTYEAPWLYLGEKWRLATRTHPWLRIDTGEEVTLARYDYEANDWEVMP